MTYTLSGFLFDLDQSNVCRDVAILEPLVKECIPSPEKIYKHTRTRRLRTRIWRKMESCSSIVGGARLASGRPLIASTGLRSRGMVMEYSCPPRVTTRLSGGGGKSPSMFSMGCSHLEKFSRCSTRIASTGLRSRRAVSAASWRLVRPASTSAMKSASPLLRTALASLTLRGADVEHFGGAGLRKLGFSDSAILPNRRIFRA